MSGKRVAVVGAGYSGLSAGYELVRRGVRCQVYEAAAAAGGLAGCFRLGDAWIEKYYHHWFNHDQDMLGLTRELGLERHLIRRETVTGSFHDHQIYRLSSPFDVLRFKPLSVIDRLRLGRMVLKARGIDDHRTLEGTTAREWICRTAGRRVYDVVWRPLFEGKFGSYADQVSAVWFWGKLRTRGQSRSRRQREELVYLDGGLQRLTRALIRGIVDGGGGVHVQCPVRRLRRHDGVWEVMTAKGSERFDEVLLTTPTPVSTALVDDWPEGFIRQANAIPYLGVTTLVLVLNRPMSPAYWLNVNDPGYPFVGVIEHTNFQSPEAYGGRHVVYLTKYRDETHETCGMRTAEILERWKGPLQRMFPSFEESWIELAMSWQNAHAQPVVVAGSERCVLPNQTPLPGVWMSCMAQVYPEDRGMNYAVRMGRQTAERILTSDGIPAVRTRKMVRVSWPAEEPMTVQPAAAFSPI